MKINKWFIILTILLVFFSSSVVNARWFEAIEGAAKGATQEQKYAQDARLADGDFEVTCVYKNAFTMTITKRSIILSSVSNESSADNRNFRLYLQENQRNLVDGNGTVTMYNYDNLLNNGRCPEKLYAYRVAAKYSDSVDGETTGGSDTEDGDIYLYSTINKLDAGTHQGGFLWLSEKQNAVAISDFDNKLVSESYNLISAKTVPICDYQLYVEDKTKGKSSVTASIYLFKNITFLELDGYTSSINTYNASNKRIERVTYKDCPVSSTNTRLYINSPKPVMVSGSAGFNASNEYKTTRYFSGVNNEQCKTDNDGKNCSAFEFLGKRNGSALNNQQNVCQVIGNKLVGIIQEIMKILQILVPVLVIVLTSLDISKLIVSGDIDEELPKKKKVIIARIIVMILFFFLPLLTNMIIGWLKTAGVIGIQEIDCIYPEDNTEGN